MLKVGDLAPDFSLLSGNGDSIRLQDYRGQRVVLFFYPDDDTPTCTDQVCAFQNKLSQLQQQDAVVFGVSPDSVKSHKKFASKYGLTYPLLSDESKEVHKLYGVWKKKKLFGREYMGVIRSTFVLDRQGRIYHIFSKVRIKKHVENILTVLTGMDSK
ncbi:MAG: thioredoxin-dependent thiol peroxidase [Ignavibacteriae bacterium]|nr:thioredoxin-dependent thiol peroxidase [Ignavibacteriota bacterium]